MVVDCVAICACSSVATALPQQIPSSRSGYALATRSVFPTRMKAPQYMVARVGSIARAGLGDSPSGNRSSSVVTSVYVLSIPAVYPEAGYFLVKEDWKYLGKGLTGCLAGAGLIKYGSILAPQITQPNLSIALFMIFAPVVASVVLLSVASSSSRSSDS